MALKQVKNKIVSTKKTGQVTKAMEAVSAVKMRKSQEKALNGRPYAFSAMRVLSRLANSQEGLSHPFTQKREKGKTLLVVVTSDKGLAGSVNSAVLKRVEEELEQNPETDMITVGRKALDFAKRSGKTVVSEYVNVSDDVTMSDVYDIAKIIIDQFAGDTYAKVEVVYQNFLSTFEQKLIKRTVLPLEPSELNEIMLDIKPKTGKYSEDVMDLGKIASYKIEPSGEEVLESLIPQLVQIIIYHALLESKACEHSARMVAMKNATDKSKEVVKDLTIAYNKERQAAITAEVSEITGGITAMGG